MVTGEADLPARSGPEERAQSLWGGLWQRAAQGALQALWVGIIPALLALLVHRFLVPAVASGSANRLVALANLYPVPLVVASFFLFSAIVRYWRLRLPWGRYAAPLPAHLVPDEADGDRLSVWVAHVALYETLASRPMQQRLDRGPSDAAAVLNGALGELRRAVEECDLAAASSAARQVRDLAATSLGARRRREALGLVASVLAAAGAAFFLRAQLFQPYRVLSASMLPTLEPGDYLAGNRLAYRPLVARAAGPRRGDVVVFRSSAVSLARPGVPDVLVKRVIGLPGDRMAMRGPVPVINGWALPYCEAGPYLYVTPEGQGRTVHGKLRVEFLDDQAYLVLASTVVPFEGTYVVKPGEVFVLGDNRGNSLDSRAWRGGVPFDGIEGKAQWFLVGSHRSGDADLGRLFRPLDTLARKLRVEGLDAQAVEDGVARCLATRPEGTHPPAPEAMSANDVKKGPGS